MSEKKMKKTETKPEKKMIMPAKPKKRPPSMIEPARSPDIWMEFDKAFERFRRDFESALWPHEKTLGHDLPSLADMETLSHTSTWRIRVTGSSSPLKRLASRRKK